MGLQAGVAQPALVNAAKWHPMRTTHDHPTHALFLLHYRAQSRSTIISDRHIFCELLLCVTVVICIALLSLIHQRRRRTRRQWTRVYLDYAMRNAHPVGDVLLAQPRPP